MSGKRVHLTLFQKALILVAVPLAFELLLLATVTGLLFKSEQEARQAERSKAVIAKTTEVVQLLFDVGVAYVAYDVQTNDFFEQRLRNDLDAIPKDLRELEELVRDHPEHHRIVESVGREAMNQVRMIFAAKADIAKGAKLNILQALSMRRALNDIVHQLDSIITDEKMARRADPDDSTPDNLPVKIALLAGFVTSIILALFLVSLFHKSTTSRLGVLMENSTKIGEGELGALLEGDDEIARIDRMFHKTDADLKEANRKRAEMEQMKQQFVAMISHDLRTPLTAVKSTLELLRAGVMGALSDKAQVKVSRAEDNLRHTIDLINNLLDLEKMESGKMELVARPTTAAAILRRGTSAVSSLAENKSITLDIPISDLALNVDEQRLTQVLINLLGNAIKFSPENSTITVTVEQQIQQMMVTVRDQGVGIPPAQTKSVFERFHQVSPADATTRQGTGLGLAICKAIVEAHGGTIGVDSVVGKGSTFWFRIPLQAPEEG